MLERTVSLDDWLPLMDEIQLAINNRPLKTINVSPFSLLTGRTLEPTQEPVPTSALPTHAWNSHINLLTTIWSDHVNKWQIARINDTARDFRNRHKIDNSDIPINSLVFYKHQKTTKWNSKYWDGPGYISSINNSAAFHVTDCCENPSHPIPRSIPRDQIHVVEIATPFHESDLIPRPHPDNNHNHETEMVVNPDWIIALVAARFNESSPDANIILEEDILVHSHYDIMFQWSKDKSKVFASWLPSSKLPPDAVSDYFNPLLTDEDSSFYCHYSPFFKV